MCTPVFITCKIPKIEYRSCTLHNEPINLSLIVRIRKSKEAYYPDNTGIPAIDFDTESKGERQLKWCFNSFTDRDAEYERILSAFDGGINGQTER